jgi:outer membrane protein OmpA-like peptidoglycan-associated protein
VFEQEADRIAEQVVGTNSPAEGTIGPPRVTPVVTSVAQRIPAIERADSNAFYGAEISRGRAPPLSNNIENYEGPACALTLQRKCACGGGLPCSQCEDEQETLAQRKTAPGSGEKNTAAAETHPQNLGFGRPLDNGTRVFMESRFGWGFGQVRIHDNPRAAAAAHSVHALAYTVGNDIVFGAAQYSPATDAGKKLLAHELTHVLQQNGGPTDACLQRKEADFDRTKDNKTEGGDAPDLRLDCPTPPTGLGNHPPVPPCDQPTHVPSATELARFHFCLDSDIVVPTENLDDLDQMIREQPSATRFVVHAYASSEGDPQYNLRLSCHRANAIGVELKERLEKSLKISGKNPEEIQAEVARRIETGGRGPTSEFSGGREKNRVAIVYGQIPGQNLGFEPACEIAPRHLGDIRPEVPCDISTTDLRQEPNSDQLAKFQFCLDSDVLVKQTPQDIQDFAHRQAASATFVVQGFASNEGAADYNKRLSCHRALRIARELINVGVPSTQIREVSGLGKTDHFGDDKHRDLNRVALVLAEKGEIAQIVEPAADPRGKGDNAVLDAARGNLLAGQYQLAADAYISLWTCGRTPSMQQAVRRLNARLPKDPNAPSVQATSAANGIEESLGPNVVELSTNALRCDNPVECTMGRLIDMAFHHAVIGDKDLGKFADDRALRHKAGLHLIALAGLGPCLGRSAQFRPSPRGSGGIDLPLATDPLAFEPLPKCARTPQPTRLLAPQPGEKDRHSPDFITLEKTITANQGGLKPLEVKGIENGENTTQKPRTTVTESDIITASATVGLLGAKSTFADYEVGFIQTIVDDLTTAEYITGDQALHKLPTPIRAAQPRGEPAPPEPWTGPQAFKRADPDGIVRGITAGFRLDTDFAAFLSFFRAPNDIAGDHLDFWNRTTRVAIWLVARRIGAPLDRFSVVFVDGIEYEVSQAFDLDIRRVRPPALDPANSQVFNDEEHAFGTGTFSARETSAEMPDQQDARLLNPAASEIDFNRQRRAFRSPKPSADGLSVSELKEVIREIVDGIQIFGSEEDMRNNTNATTVPRLGFEFSPLDITLKVSRSSGRIGLSSPNIMAPRVGGNVLFHLSQALGARLKKSDFLGKGKSVALSLQAMKALPGNNNVAIVKIFLEAKDREPKLEDMKGDVDIREDMAEMFVCTDLTNNMLDGREFGAVYWIDRDKKLHREPKDKFQMSGPPDGSSFTMDLPCTLQPNGMLMGTVHTHPGCVPECRQETANPSPKDRTLAGSGVCGLQNFLISIFGVRQYFPKGNDLDRRDIATDLQSRINRGTCKQVKSPDDLEKAPARKKT